MFKITDELTFKREVKFLVPVDGGHETHSLDFTFRVLEIDEDELLIEGGIRAVLKKVIVKIDGMLDDDDRPIPYSDKMRDRLLGKRFIELAALKAYSEACSKVVEGN